MSRSDQQVPDVVRTPDPAGRSDAPRSQAQFFVPAPRGPASARDGARAWPPAQRRRHPRPGGSPRCPRAHLDGDDADPAPDDRYPGPLLGDRLPGPLGPGEGYADPHPGDRYVDPLDGLVGAGRPTRWCSGACWACPPGPVSTRRSVTAVRRAALRRPAVRGMRLAARGVPDAPVLPAARHSGAKPATASAPGHRPAPARGGVRHRRPSSMPRCRRPRRPGGDPDPLPLAAAVVYAVAAGLAARQLVRAWGSVPWQADVAAGLGSVPVVLAALVGPQAVVGPAPSARWWPSAAPGA